MGQRNKGVRLLALIFPMWKSFSLHQDNQRNQVLPLFFLLGVLRASVVELSI